MSAQLALEIIGLSRSFGALKAVDQVSMRVTQGRTHGLIGPNGAGKTTLFNLVAGALVPSSGEVRVFGEDLTGQPSYRLGRRGLLRTFQNTRPIEHVSVRENVLVGAYRTGRSGAVDALLRTKRARREEQEAREHADQLIKELGLATVAYRLPHSLTAGQRRLLEICRALAARPRILLLDEPAAGLSRHESAELEEQLRRLERQGTTCLLVEHDVELVLRLCSEITVLNFGQVIARGEPRFIRSSPEVAEAYIGGRASESDQSHD